MQKALFYHGKIMNKKTDLVDLLHGAIGFVVPSMWIKAIDNNQFTSWPGLMSALVKKHLSPIISTAEGHQRQEHSNLQSTKNIKKTKVKVEEDKL